MVEVVVLRVCSSGMVVVTNIDGPLDINPLGIEM